MAVLEIDTDRLQNALQIAAGELLSARNDQGYWTGELSSSALSTATAVVALSIYGRELPSEIFKSKIQRGIEWLARHANPDGGWGDTTKSLSNISTTALCWAAFGVMEDAPKRQEVVRGAEEWLSRAVGNLSPASLARALVERYGNDRTFSAPILTMCALSGRLGHGADAWEHVLQLPFELAAFPRRWFAALKMPVVSYALPALIAIGQAKHFHAPTKNSLLRALRNFTCKKTLRVLEQIQPPNGGFLEATPLTSFVLMSLASSGQAGHLVSRRCAEFLVSSQRPDGSWAIDTNLATWTTTLSVNALAEDSASRIPRSEFIQDWLLKQQFFTRHFYTEAEPGGWAWTNLPGGVPDADDTASALLALYRLGLNDAQVNDAVHSGLAWLFGLQNDDGGIPTFCRGWGTLPFDRSAPDLTAHAIRAWLVWYHEVPGELADRSFQHVRRGVRFLAKTQRANGSWTPLWFGNQYSADEENPVYGTSRVLVALAEIVAFRDKADANISVMLNRGIQFLVRTQNEDGSWSGEKGKQPSVEETALAVESLAACYEHCEFARHQVKSALMLGLKWLLEKVESGQWKEASPIGFYFAKLWYFEKLYPQIFTVAALNRACSALA